MSDARTWSIVAQNISRPGVVVSTADTSRDTTIETVAARALADTQGDLVVLAHSMGGRVALEMGRQAPERVRAMVLANSNIEGLGDKEIAHREKRIAEANTDMVAYARSWVPKVISAASRQRPELVAAISQMVEDCPPEVHERQNRALMARPNATWYLPMLSFPILLVSGSEGHLSTSVTNCEIAQHLRDTEIRIIHDTGYLLPFERPEELSVIVRDWIRRRNIALS